MTTTRTRVKVRKTKGGGPYWRVIRTPEGGFPKTDQGRVAEALRILFAPVFPTFAEAIEYAHTITHQEQE